MMKKIGIIGAGIVGSTAAYYLTKNKQQVTVFDDGVGQATAAAAGIISPWLSQRRNKEWYFLAKEGARFYEDLIADLETHSSTQKVYQKTGTVLYKKNEALLKKLENLAIERKQAAPEIGNIHTLSTSDIQALIPDIRLDSPALFISGGAKVDGAGLTELLLAEVTRKQNTVIKEKITKIEPVGNQWLVYDHQEVHTFDFLILACGAWLGDLLRPLNFHVDIRGQKGQLIEVQTKADTTNAPVIMPVGEIDVIPFDEGKILIGATHENEEEYDLTPNKEKLNQLKIDGEEILSNLMDAQITGHRVGTRAYTSDFSPFFGEIETLSNLLVASGLGSSGLTTGPVIGKTLADWTLDVDTPFENYRDKPNQYVFPK